MRRASGISRVPDATPLKSLPKGNVTEVSKPKLLLHLLKYAREC
jgi:hypothetical protein